jgi:transposase
VNFSEDLDVPRDPIWYHGVMNDTPLFPDEPDAVEPAARPDVDFGPLPPPRLRRPERSQVLLQPVCLDELLPNDHAARTIWTLVGSWDLSPLLDAIKARGDQPGRAATDPRLLVALWLYAATCGVASARELERLCRESDPYRWLCGGLSVNYHTLSDFRVGHQGMLDSLLTQMLAVLIRGEVVSVHRIAQDGTRVRAGAGSKSFRRGPTIESALQAARAHLEIIKRQAERGGEVTARQRAAQERAAREKQERLEQAAKEVADLARAKDQQKAKPTKDNPPRASSTDPEARFMRMPDGGNRPAYNVQLAADTTSRVIVGVDVTNAGSDAGLSGPMRRDVAQRTGQTVSEQLLDGGYVQLAEIDQADADETTLYMPLPKPRKSTVDPHLPKPGDSAAVAEWRRRMGTDQAKSIYKERAATIETINGELKTQRGLDRFRVRGTSKARCVVLWAALAYNVVHVGAVLLQLIS